MSQVKKKKRKSRQKFVVYFIFTELQHGVRSLLSTESAVSPAHTFTKADEQGKYSVLITRYHLQSQNIYPHIKVPICCILLNPSTPTNQS